jgi:hypothetical protein
MTDLTTSLVAQIEAEHAAAHDAARSAIEHAIACGQLLAEAKAGVGHGAWLPWVKTNLSFGERQARKYMRLARHVDELPNRTLNSDLTIDGALALLAGPRSGRRTIFDEILVLGGKIRPRGLELPEELSFEDWAKIGELLSKLERGSEDLNAWTYVQAALHQEGERLLVEVERLEPRQAELREASADGRALPAAAESVIDRTRAWIAWAEMWSRACARRDLALAVAQLKDSVESMLQARYAIVLLEDGVP